MRVEFQIDSDCTEPHVIIRAASMTDEVVDAMKRLSASSPDVICGFFADALEIIDPDDIYNIYTQAGKLYAVTDKGEYALRMRLYEVMDRLDKSRFVRISNSEIVNLKKVRNFDLSISGTICVKLNNGSSTYVSRRYVAKIKQTLGI